MPTVMDMRIDAITLSDAVDLVVSGITGGQGGTVLTPNIDILRQWLASPDLRLALEDTDLLVADGRPLLVALRLQRTPIPEQITGTDLLWAVSAAAASGGHSVMLAGGRPGDADRAADSLRQRLPALRAQTYPCFVRPQTEAAELEKLAAILLAARPDVVFIGLPFATQVVAMRRLRVLLPRTWFIGVGSSFELINGDRRRPPRWVQVICLEWAWRVTQQPRMWRRYFVEGMPIAARLGVSALLVRWR